MKRNQKPLKVLKRQMYRFIAIAAVIAVISYIVLLENNDKFSTIKGIAEIVIASYVLYLGITSHNDRIRREREDNVFWECISVVDRMTKFINKGGSFHDHRMGKSRILTIEHEGEKYSVEWELKYSERFSWHEFEVVIGRYANKYGQDRMREYISLMYCSAISKRSVKIYRCQVTCSAIVKEKKVQMQMDKISEEDYDLIFIALCSIYKGSQYASTMSGSDVYL